jgi:microcystin synthetase protein McyA
VVDGILQIQWSYSRAIHHAATIRTLAEGYIHTLRDLIAHCMSPGVGSYTPSDFTALGLDQAELDDLLRIL